MLRQQHRDGLSDHRMATATHHREQHLLFLLHVRLQFLLDVSQQRRNAVRGQCMRAVRRLRPACQAQQFGQLAAMPELAELAKLLETTYLGVLIAWAQEMERLAAQYEGSFSDVNRFIEEIDFLPSHIFPGAIGGHCVLPNIELLRSRVESQFLDLVVESNALKQQAQSAVCTGAANDQDRTDRVGVLGA